MMPSVDHTVCATAYIHLSTDISAQLPVNKHANEWHDFVIS